MAQNIEQAAGNLSVLDSSAQRLGGARDEFKGQRHVLKESHGLLGTLKKQSVIEKCVGTAWVPPPSPRPSRGRGACRSLAGRLLS